MDKVDEVDTEEVTEDAEVTIEDKNGWSDSEGITQQDRKSTEKLSEAKPSHKGQA